MALNAAHTAAFFDMDQTILCCNSAQRYVRYLFKRGEMPAIFVLKTLGWLVRYRLAVLDAEAVIRRVLRSNIGQSEDEIHALCEMWFEDEIKHTISSDGQAVVADHRARGHKVVLLTAATHYIAQRVADFLDLDDVVCTRLEVVDNCLTGQALNPLCYGVGKRTLAQRWANANNVSLRQSYFYTDSYTDRPTIDIVGHAVAVNPDPRLTRYARQRRFPIQRWGP